MADGRWARIGSTNLNIASWLGNYELDVVVEDADFARLMETMYLDDLTNATEVLLDNRSRLQAPPAPPAGFNGILTHRQWRGVVEFSHAVDARIVTSFATSAGVRDAAGVWTPDQARRLIAYTRSLGGSIAARRVHERADARRDGRCAGGYDAAAYGRDFTVFRTFARLVLPSKCSLDARASAFVACTVPSRRSGGA